MDFNWEFRFSRRDYENNVEIQRTLELIGLDKNKFWHALQYIHYMVELWNTDCVPMEPSIHEEIADLIHALKEEKTVVTIKRRGKKAYPIAGGKTREFLVAFLEYGDSIYSDADYQTYTGKSVMFREDVQDQNLKWQIYDEYEVFVALFQKYCTDGALPPRVKRQRGSRDKDLLVSRLLYFTGLVTDYGYWLTKDRLHAVKSYCRANRRPLMTSGLL